MANTYLKKDKNEKFDKKFSKMTIRIKMILYLSLSKNYDAMYDKLTYNYAKQKQFQTVSKTSHYIYYAIR